MEILNVPEDTERGSLMSRLKEGFEEINNLDVNLQPDISKTREIIEPILGNRSSFTKEGKLSPFFKPPYQRLHPGSRSNLAYKLHKILHEIFDQSGQEIGFMGSKYGLPFGQTLWNQKLDLIFSQDGYVDSERNFHAPIAVYRWNDFIPEMTRLRYILFQQGSYQPLLEDQGKMVEEGKLLVHRGIGDKEQFIEPQIAKEVKNRYMQYLLNSFVSPLISFPYNNVSRHETDHILHWCPFLRSTRIDGKFYHYLNLEQSFSTKERISRDKFGPKYVSFEVPIDDVRLITEWAGEGEVYILDSGRAKRVK